MRPDQHKKKKSSQYKKKHEVAGSAKQTLRDSKEKKKNVDEKSDPVNSPQVKKSTEEKVHQVLKTLGKEEHGYASSFSKRQITSNWERYLPEDKKETVIGTEFDILLNTTGGPDSYMKLNSENNWEDENMLLSSILTLDCSKLSSELQELSFEEKYRINDLLLDVRLKKCLCSDGLERNTNEKEHKTTFNPFAQALRFDFIKPKLQKDFQVENENIFQEVDNLVLNTSKKNDSDILSTKSIDNILGSDKKDKIDINSNSTEESSSCKSDVTTDFKSQKSLNNMTVKLSPEKNALECKEYNLPKPNKEVKITKNSVIDEDLEIELDDILNLGSGKVPEVHQKNFCGHQIPTLNEKDEIKQKKNEKTEQEDLEDWLDSII